MPTVTPGARPARGSHNPHPLDRRGAGREQRPPRRTDGCGADGVCPLVPVPQACSGRPRLAGSRPVRPVGRARLRAPLLAPPPGRLRPPARRAEALPPARVADAGTPGVRRRPGNRGDHRTPWPGNLECRRDGHRRAAPRGRVQPPRPRDHRPPDVRPLLGRRPPGGHLGRGGEPGRAPAPGQARLPLGRQPHPARRTHVDGLGRGRPGPVRRVRLEHAAASRTGTTSKRSRRPSRRRARTTARASSPSGRRSPTARRTSREARRRTVRRSGRTRCA